MERGDFGLIVQAAARQFDITQVGPGYHTRLHLILRELGAMNQAEIVSHEALYCAIGQVGVDQQTRETNFKYMGENRELHKKLRHVMLDTAPQGLDALVEAWRKQYGKRV